VGRERRCHVKWPIRLIRPIRPIKEKGGAAQSAISRRQKKKELLASGKSAGQGGKPTKREIEEQEEKVK